MSAIPSVSAPQAGAPARSDLALSPLAVARPAVAARLETARAVLPVDGAPAAADVRFADRQGRPVGPPPAFQVSLLEARREAAMNPPTARSPGMAEGETGFDRPAADNPPEQVDRKV
jgi:hypothetical protein